MGKEQVVSKMAKIISSQFVDSHSNNLLLDLSNEERLWIQTNIPNIVKDQILIYLIYEESKILVCLEELDWITFQDIEASSYRQRILDEIPQDIVGDPIRTALFKESQNESKVVFYSGEYERRNILANAIVWVADVTSKKIMHNENQQILTKLSHHIVPAIWDEFNKAMTLSIKEANTLYESAYGYFSGTSKDKPISSIVNLVDIIIKLGRLSLEDIKKMKYSEMEKIKLVLKARSEALLLTQNVIVEEK